MATQTATYSRGTQPRTVAFVHDSHTFGGMELHMLMLMRYFDRSRYLPAVYVPGYTEPYLSPPQRFIDEAVMMGLPILRPPHPGMTRGVSQARDIVNTARLFRRQQVRVIHIHTNVPTGAQKATLAARLGGVGAVVRSEHLPPSHFGLTQRARVSAKLFDTLTDCIIAGSHACWEEQLRVMGRKRVRLSLYGIELDRFKPSHNVAAAKRKLGFNPELPVVGAIGRLSELKGHTYFISAAARVARELGRPVQFLLVGDGPLREELEAQAAGLGLSDCFQFAGFQSNTVPYMEATDIAVMPTSINEGISLAMLEFMAMGKPMIATDDPSFEETVVDGQSGLIVRKKDANGLATAILRLLRNPEEASALRREALNIVQTRFDVRRQAGEMMDLYDTLLDLRARVAA